MDNPRQVIQAVLEPYKGWIDGKSVVDAIVVMVKKGEMKTVLQNPLPPSPEFEHMQWGMHTTMKTMLHIVCRLVNERSRCCSFHQPHCAGRISCVSSSTAIASMVPNSNGTVTPPYGTTFREVTQLQANFLIHLLCRII